MRTIERTQKPLHTDEDLVFDELRDGQAGVEGVPVHVQRFEQPGQLLVPVPARVGVAGVEPQEDLIEVALGDLIYGRQV